MAAQLIPRWMSPWIHIDWSCINSTTNLYLLRASLSIKGRSIVFYEECHPKKKENNHVTHQQFLKSLKAVLPRCESPIIVTDAGFRAPWFMAVRQMGWHFVGRLRNKNLVLLENAGVCQQRCRLNFKTIYFNTSSILTRRDRDLSTAIARAIQVLLLKQFCAKIQHVC